MSRAVRRPAPRKPAPVPVAKGTWGGRRAGAGRKPNGLSAGVSHRKRAKLDPANPVHVILRVLKGVPDLRTRSRAAIVIDAVRLATEQHGMRVVHFSIQSGELQFIVEIDRHRALADGIKSLAISIARRLNGHLEREGTVFLDRYEAKPLRTAEEVRNALVQLYMSHGKPKQTPFDPVSSAPYFDGFIKAVPPAADNDDAPVSPAETRLLRVAWRRLGLLTPKDARAANPRRKTKK